MIMDTMTATEIITIETVCHQLFMKNMKKEKCHHVVTASIMIVTDMVMDTHAEELITTVTAMDTSETMDTHQAPHVEMVCTCTSMTIVEIAMITAEDMVTWIVETM